MWVMLTPECVALPPIASAAPNFVNIGPIFTPHNQGFLKPLSIPALKLWCQMIIFIYLS